MMAMEVGGPGEVIYSKWLDYFLQEPCLDSNSKWQVNSNLEGVQTSNIFKEFWKTLERRLWRRWGKFMMTLHGGEKDEDVVVVIASTIPPGKDFSYFGHEG